VGSRLRQFHPPLCHHEKGSPACSGWPCLWLIIGVRFASTRAQSAPGSIRWILAVPYLFDQMVTLALARQAREVGCPL
jgi:hypothetical protein